MNARLAGTSRAPWSGASATHAAAVVPVVLLLCTQGKTCIFLTNNSMKSRLAYLEKFKQLGVHATVVRVCGWVGWGVWVAPR